MASWIEETNPMNEISLTICGHDRRSGRSSKMQGWYLMDVIKKYTSTFNKLKYWNHYNMRANDTEQ